MTRPGRPGWKILKLTKKLARSTWLQRVILTAGLGALVATTIARWDDVVSAARSAGTIGIAAAVMAAVMALILQWAAWRVVMNQVDTPLPLGLSLRIYGLSVTGKYLPGGFWTTLLQVELAALQGLRRRSTLVASASAMILTVVVGGLLGLAALPSVLSQDGASWAWFLLLLIPLGLLLLPRNISRIGRWAGLAGGAQLRIGARYLLGAGLLTLSSWCMLGLSVWVVGQGVAELEFITAVTGFCLSWTLGFLVVVAPAGTGVRDVLLVVALEQQMPRDAAIAIAILSRAVLTLVDLGIGGVALLSSRGLRRSREVGLSS